MGSGGYPCGCYGRDANANTDPDRNANADGDARPDPMQRLDRSAPLCLTTPEACLLPAMAPMSMLEGVYSNGALRNDLLRYDPGNDSGHRWLPRLTGTRLSQAVYFKGKLYNMGGYVGDLSHVSDTTRIYDIATDTWTTGASMPATLGAQATVLWNGVIYVAGGYDGGGEVDTLYAYDIASDTWSDARADATGTVFPRLRGDQRQVIHCWRLRLRGRVQHVADLRHRHKHVDYWSERAAGVWGTVAAPCLTGDSTCMEALYTRARQC